MSVDNYLLVRKHPRGGYGVVMGFASDDEDPVLDPDATSYDTVPAALAAAFKEEGEEIVEYGVSVHSEVGDEWVSGDAGDGRGPRPTVIASLGGVRHEDHWDFPPYCPQAPTVEVVPDRDENPLRMPITRTCHEDWHVLVGQKIGCACGTVMKRR